MKSTMNKYISMQKLTYKSNQLCEIVEKLRSRTTIKIISCIKPQQGQIKLNIDENNFEHNGKVGVVGTERGKFEILIFAFALPIQCGDHNEVEAMATQFAIKWLKARGYNSCVVKNILLIDYKYDSK